MQEINAKNLHVFAHANMCVIAVAYIATLCALRLITMPQ